ncbi:hypothetical protein ACIP2Y_09965 [Streptomyces sviceus]|uniref:hypothetical protein n=1 Tax=Streptomyces sviceus TaxID=285530 RepID=UPI00381E8C4A
MAGLQSGDGSGVGVDEPADEFDGPGPHPRIGIARQVPRCGLQDPLRARRAGVAPAPVAGQGMERGDPDPGVGIAGHADQLVHGLGLHEMVERVAAGSASGPA